MVRSLEDQDCVALQSHTEFTDCSFSSRSVEGEFEGIGKKGKACVQLARILQYLECPQ